MDKQQLIISIIANLDCSKNRPSMLRDEDFAPDPDGDWVKGKYGYTSIQTSFHMLMIPYTGLEMFSMYTPEDARVKLRAQRQEERQKIEAAFWDEIDKLTKLKIVTTQEYRLVRYATERAEEIIRESERIFIRTNAS